MGTAYLQYIFTIYIYNIYIYIYIYMPGVLKTLPEKSRAPFDRALRLPR
jgi:hypothetical protein